jgi:hypothetical protein
MAEVLIVSRTLMGARHCIGAIDLETLAPLRLEDQAAHGQPPDSDLAIGEVWEIDYAPLANTSPPHMEDVSATIHSYVRDEDVEEFLRVHAIEAFEGDSDVLFDGTLHWTDKGRGYMEPVAATAYSTAFWRPSGLLWRNPGFDPGTFAFREPATNHHVKWVGVEEPPERIPAGTLCRVSLTRPFAGSLDHPVCWLQLSGAY